MRLLRAALCDDAGSDRFFFAAAEDPAALRREIFYLSYHLHWSYSEAMGLDIEERREYVRMLVDSVERENQAIARARSGR